MTNTYDAYVIGYSGVYVKKYEEDIHLPENSRVEVTGDLQQAQTISNKTVAHCVLDGVRRIASFDHFVLIQVEVTVTLKKKAGSLG